MFFEYKPTEPKKISNIHLHFSLFLKHLHVCKIHPKQGENLAYTNLTLLLKSVAENGNKEWLSYFDGYSESELEKLFNFITNNTDKIDELIMSVTDKYDVVSYEIYNLFLFGAFSEQFKCKKSTTITKNFNVIPDSIVEYKSNIEDVYATSNEFVRYIINNGFDDGTNIIVDTVLFEDFLGYSISNAIASKIKLNGSVHKLSEIDDCKFEIETNEARIYVTIDNLIESPTVNVDIKQGENLPNMFDLPTKSFAFKEVSLNKYTLAGKNVHAFVDKCYKEFLKVYEQNRYK